MSNPIKPRNVERQTWKEQASGAKTWHITARCNGQLFHTQFSISKRDLETRFGQVWKRIRRRQAVYDLRRVMERYAKTLPLLLVIGGMVIRKLHLVRPDLIPYPLDWAVYA